MTGCLARILVPLGMAALLFVLACMTGLIVIRDGKPVLSLETVHVPEVGDAGKALEGVGKTLSGLSWPYSLKSSGLTVKTLRAGKGMATLVCADGYTMLVDAGSGAYSAVLQAYLCGVRQLQVALATGSEDAYLGGMAKAVTMLHPQYLLYQDSQTKGSAYNAMLEAAREAGTSAMVPKTGMSFMLGRARVTCIAPLWTPHVESRDDSLVFRVDYGNSSVLLGGTLTAQGMQELAQSRQDLSADLVICPRGGREEAWDASFFQKPAPKTAFLAKDADNMVQLRLLSLGMQVKSGTVLTAWSDGETWSVR